MITCFSRCGFLRAENTSIPTPFALPARTGEPKIGSLKVAQTGKAARWGQQGRRTSLPGAGKATNSERRA